MTDPHIFDGWEERMQAEGEKPRRWCKCGHVEGVHFSMAIPTDEGIYEAPLRCHTTGCHCYEFRPKKRMNKVKFWLTGRG